MDNINYIRNSVKATVDAYDGSVTLYAWDDRGPDPARPGRRSSRSTVKPMSEMSGDLLSHVRYPADLFKVQRAILGIYHVTDAELVLLARRRLDHAERPAATGHEDAAAAVLPDDADAGAGRARRSRCTRRTFPQATQRGTCCAGYLAVDADAGNTAGEDAPDYGKFTLLALPKHEHRARPRAGAEQLQLRPDGVHRSSTC